nr:nicastrin [Tanacetum cinerariifolium]
FRDLHRALYDFVVSIAFAVEGQVKEKSKWFESLRDMARKLKIAVNNKDKKETYATKVTEFDLVMQTTKARTRDSEACLNEGTCLPLGGYSKRMGCGRWFLDVLLLREVLSSNSKIA